MIHSSAYPKILALGHRDIASIFDDEVEITEKIDGSQFGFGKLNGELVIRSKGQELDIDNPDNMFRAGVEYVKSIETKLPEDVFFYGEYLQKPRHSTLAYKDIPRNHIALFGVKLRDSSWLRHVDLENVADDLGVDLVPVIYRGKSSPEHALSLVDGESYLGGQKREGIVVKAYKSWMWMNMPLTVMAGKFVSEQFKEVHEKDWSRLNTGKGKFDVLKDKYRSEARWHKAIMHLKERGEFEGSPRDIGKLIKEICQDIELEARPEIMDDLWKIFSGDILRAATAGFPQWYKEALAKGEL